MVWNYFPISHHSDGNRHRWNIQMLPPTPQCLKIRCYMPLFGPFGGLHLGLMMNSAVDQTLCHTTCIKSWSKFGLVTISKMWPSSGVAFQGNKWRTQLSCPISTINNPHGNAHMAAAAPFLYSHDELLSRCCRNQECSQSFVCTLSLVEKLCPCRTRRAALRLLFLRWHNGWGGGCSQCADEKKCT